jgi:hypothetical protein
MELDLAYMARPRRLARPLEPDTPTKTCRCCRRSKSLSAFASHPLSKDGHRHDCAKCVKAGKTKRCPKKSAAHTRAARRRRKSNPRVQAVNRVAVKNWTRRNPLAPRARAAVKYALTTGRIARPRRCQAKGCTREKVEAHHSDYLAPLSVLWTCRSHHRRLHAGEAVALKAGVDRRLARIPRELAA